MSTPDAAARRRFLAEYEDEIWKLFTSLVDYSADCGYPLLQHPSYEAFAEFVLASSTVSSPSSRWRLHCVVPEAGPST